MFLEETGLYSYVTTNSNGCDSTISLDFTLFNSNFSIENISSCESYVFKDEEYSESGMYSFEGVNTNGCDSTVIIDLKNYESITENIIYGNPEPEPFSISLYSAFNNGTNLIWTVEGGNIIEINGNSINIQWGNQGIGLITLLESNDICDDFTNVFTVNIGGQIEPTCGTNGTSWATAFSEPIYYSIGSERIESKDSVNVNIYPNPSSNIFNLELNSDSKSEIIVTNVLGEQVYFESIKSIGEFNTQIDLSNYSKGIYNLTIKTSDGISNHKLILQ